MQKFTAKDKQAFNIYKELDVKRKDFGSYLIECQRLLEIIVKEAVWKSASISVSGINDGIRDHLDKVPDFIDQVKPNGFPVYKREYNKFKENAVFINKKANSFKHHNESPSEMEADVAKDYIDYCFDWYVKIFIGATNSSSTDENTKNASPKILPAQKKQERITERETYYVVLLVDSSESMLWPYLKGGSNNDDYKNATTEVQKAMQFAHEKALNALRGSSICSEGYLQLYQYTFNHRIRLLNPPEVLAASQFTSDNVAKINSTNYSPSGMTALYEVIHESLKVVYEKYLKETMEKDFRINKVIIGVITDGVDTVLDEEQKTHKISEIKQYLRMLRGNGDMKKNFLISSVLIGLTGSDFSDNKLKEIKKELTFDESISINQADDQSIRKAFKLFSTNTINI